jgi:hypothetical protein
MTTPDVLQPIREPSYWERCTNQAARIKPLGTAVYDVASRVMKLTYEVFKNFGNGGGFLSTLYQFLGKIQFVSVIFIPLKIHKMIQIARSDEEVKIKTIDIATEGAGLLYIGASVFSYFSTKLSFLTPYVPYLVGVSVLFGIGDIYKKSAFLYKVHRASTDVFQDQLIKRLKKEPLTSEDKKTLINCYKVAPDKVDKFVADVKRATKKAIKSHLKERASRTMKSGKVALAASLIEFIAGGILLGVWVAAPPIGFILTVTNGALLGSSSCLKIAQFFIDRKTEKLTLGNG